jgi:hypothetical protein
MHYCAAVPFNTMDAGIVNVSVNAVSFSSSSPYAYYVGYYDPVTDTRTSLSTAVPYSAQLSFASNRDLYLLMCTAGYCNAVFPSYCTVKYDNTNYSISVSAYVPNWSCTDWSECDNYQQYRSCTDLNGKVSPKVEWQNCFVPPVYTPAAEYVTGTPVYYTDYVGALLGYHWFDPKVACQENEQHCAILSWNTNLWLLSGGLYIFWSDDGFTGSPTYEQ